MLSQNNQLIPDLILVKIPKLFLINRFDYFVYTFIEFQMEFYWSSILGFPLVASIYILFVDLSGQVQAIFSATCSTLCF